jgi:ubiquitin-conjugating enzyme E2 O
MLFCCPCEVFHFCFIRPGDHVLWKSEDQQRVAVIQSVNASERVASVHYPDTSSTELVSVLELDPHGTGDLSVAAPHSSLGVRRGDFVFIHREGSTNALEKPRVPKIGEVEAWVREIPMTMEGHLAGWRHEMAEIGAEIATSRQPGQGAGGKVRRPLKEDTWLCWCGEVTGVNIFIIRSLKTRLTLYSLFSCDWMAQSK